VFSDVDDGNAVVPSIGDVDESKTSSAEVVVDAVVEVVLVVVVVVVVVDVVGILNRVTPWFSPL